jgi:opacity protein-like surface antigen
VPSKYNFPSRWIGSVSAGPVWPTGSEKDAVYLSPYTQKTYVTQQVSNVLVNGEFFSGISTRWSHALQTQIGLTVASTGNANVFGEIWDNGQAEFNNYSYKYQIRHNSVGLKGKFLRVFNSKFMPWVSANVGVAFNNAGCFYNVPLITQAVQSPNFASKMTTAFTYTVGLGVQKAVSFHWQAGAGYEFSDWGKSQLGLAPGQLINAGPTRNHLYTNGAMFNLTYLA